jgi:predicted Co/Zn/Cd cation transporter (cation efflux family)
METRALTVSLVATLVLGMAAITWGVVSGARVILFDGVYMLAGIALVAVSLLASKAAASAPTTDYPFGRHAATPLAVALQGSALLGTVVYGAADAVGVIVAGGSEAAASSVLAYGVVSATASVLVMLWLRPAARTSDLAHAEVVSWRTGAVLSLVVAVGGVVALVLTGLDLSGVAAFVDPALVLIACAVVAPMAVSLCRDGVRELLEAAPPAALSEQIVTMVDAARSAHSLAKPTIRATVLGRRLYVEVDFVVDPGSWTVDEEDRVRRAVIDRLETLDYEVWATVDLTTDPELVQD